jgi:uncharacterized membrane protein/thiol-disulfide isomerase/thioredoxin
MNKNTPMDSNKFKLAWAIRIAISFLFLLSAVAKLYPSPYFAISTFEVKQLYTLGFSESIAPYFSRILIGVEFALGILILQRHFLQKLIIPATILLLVVFTTHLSIVSFQGGGNSGNCGCFGSLLPMTPIQAILKNVVSIILLVLLFFIISKKNESKNNFWIVSTAVLGSILLLFMLAPIQPPATTFSVSEVPEEKPVEEIASKEIVSINSESINKEEKIDSIKKLTLLKKEKVLENENEPEKHKSGFGTYFSKIDTGKKTLCFFVPGCEHCRATAKEITAANQINSTAPVSILFMNEEAELIPDFFKEAGATYPYKVVDIIEFWKILGAGNDVPGVKYLWNGNEYKYYVGTSDKKFDAAEYEKWMNKGYLELKK